MINFKSTLYPESNVFWAAIQKVLIGNEETNWKGTLLKNPKPECKGFYSTDYDKNKNILQGEAIGDIPEDSLPKYVLISSKKITQTLFFKKSRSKEFENEKLEQYQGGVIIGDRGAAISGHRAPIDEAVAVLRLLYEDAAYTDIIHVNVWKQLLLRAQKYQNENAFDNKWIPIIAQQIVNDQI